MKFYIASLKKSIDPKIYGVRVPKFIPALDSYGVEGETIYAVQDVDTPDLWVILFKNGDVVGITKAMTGDFIRGEKTADGKHAVDTTGEAQKLMDDAYARMNSHKNTEVEPDF
jgi:hypothetical protein